MTDLAINHLMTIVITLASAFVVTVVSAPMIARLMVRWRIVGVDVHKQGRPVLPEMGGLSILLGVVVASSILAVLSSSRVEIASFVLVVVIAGLIGGVDDLRPLGARVKPLLAMLASAPILLFGTYLPNPAIPFIGKTRLTLLYPITIPIAISVTANAINMFDVLNGAMSGTVSIISLVMIVMLLASREYEIAALAAALLGGLLAFHIYNRYPARVFAGDTGSLAVGAAVGTLSILGHIEVVTMVAMIPHIMNAFYGLSSMGRLYERREIANRPVSLAADGRLEATSFKDAPITLVRLILAQGPLSEREVVRKSYALSGLSALLAFITFFLTPGVVG